jgi:hypothetical protein
MDARPSGDHSRFNVPAATAADSLRRMKKRGHPMQPSSPALHPTDLQHIRVGFASPEGARYPGPPHPGPARGVTTGRAPTNPPEQRTPCCTNAFSCTTTIIDSRESGSHTWNRVPDRGSVNCLGGVVRAAHRCAGTLIASPQRCVWLPANFVVALSMGWALDADVATWLIDLAMAAAVSIAALVAYCSYALACHLRPATETAPTPAGSPQ